MAASSQRIRRALVGDCQAIVEHSKRMAKETEDLALDLDVLKAGTRELLKDSGKGIFYIIEVEGEIAGQMMITYEWSDWRNASMWWIQSVYIKPEHRRKGLFRELYSYVKAEANAANAGGLRLYVDKDNSRAQATYEAMGMKSHYTVYEESFSGY